MLYEGARPSFFDQPFAPCVLGVSEPGELVVDDVFVVPPDLYAL